MCALFGWLDYKHIVPYKVLKKLAQALANAAEERGTDAAGISYVKNGHITIYKRPKPAHKIRFNAPDNTTAIMGHTRLTTQGNQKFNQNNHPFYGHADKNFAFAHNGVLYNDAEIRKEKNLPATHIETDSYVAVQLIEQQKKLDFNSLKNMAEAVRGNFTFTVLDEENSLYIIKGSNPMCLLHFEMLGIYIYASTESIMKNALRKVNMLSFPYTKIETVNGDILRACLVSFKNNADKSEGNHLKRILKKSLTIFPKSAALVEPAERTLHDPTFWQNNESVEFIAFYYFNLCPGDSFDLVCKILSCIAAVNQKFFDFRKMICYLTIVINHINCTIPIRNISSSNHDRMRQTQNINTNMQFYSRGFFPASYPLFSAVSEF